MRGEDGIPEPQGIRSYSGRLFEESGAVRFRYHLTVHRTIEDAQVDFLVRGNASRSIRFTVGNVTAGSHGVYVFARDNVVALVHQVPGHDPDLAAEAATELDDLLQASPPAADPADTTLRLEPGVESLLLDDGSGNAWRPGLGQAAPVIATRQWGRAPAAASTDVQP